MYTGHLSPITRQRGSHLYPPLFLLFLRFEMKFNHEQGRPLNIAQGLRTWGEQDALYRIGRSVPGKIVTDAMGGQSWHNYGLAFDVSFRGVDPYLDRLSEQERERMWTALGQCGEFLGLKWGRSFGDDPHFELPVPGLDLTRARELSHSGGLAAVWKECDSLLKETIQNGMV